MYQKISAPKMHWTVEVYLPFWTKEKGWGGAQGLRFERESRQFKDRQERANMWQINSCRPTQKQWDKEGSSTSRLCQISAPATFSLYYEAKVMFPSLHQVFLSALF